MIPKKYIQPAKDVIVGILLDCGELKSRQLCDHLKDHNITLNAQQMAKFMSAYVKEARRERKCGYNYYKIGG